MRRGRGEKRRKPEAQPPDEKHHKGEPEHDVSVNAAEFVRELLCGRLLLLRLANERDDFLQCAFGGGLCDQNFHCAPEIDGSGQDGVADTFSNRRGFTGKIRLISGGRAHGNFSIHGKLRAGLDEQLHPRPQILHGHFALAVLVVERGGGLWNVAEERADFLLRPAKRKMFQGSGKGKQEQER